MPGQLSTVFHPLAPTHTLSRSGAGIRLHLLHLCTLDLAVLFQGVKAEK